MKINKEGFELVKHFEGCSLTAYPDPATGGEPVTIGYGHTGNVKMGSYISQDMAETLLLRDLAKFEDGVASLIHTQVTSDQFSACVCLAYNIGLGNFGSSTLLRMINADSALAAADQFLRWDKAAGKVMAGLTKRRKAERKLYLGESWK